MKNLYNNCRIITVNFTSKKNLTFRNYHTNLTWLSSQYIKQNRGDNNPNISNSNKEEAFVLFTGYPRHVLNDDSKSLGDLGLVPNGVLHMVRNCWICGWFHILFTKLYLHIFKQFFFLRRKKIISHKKNWELVQLNISIVLSFTGNILTFHITQKQYY